MNTPPPPHGSSHQACPRCRTTLAETAADTRCPACGDLLELRHPTPSCQGQALQELWRARRGAHEGPSASGVWRFQEAVLPSIGTAVVSHPEGNTPLLRREVLSRYAGVRDLLLKHEGHNPTGSFKDRGMTVAVSQARRLAATAVACASTGNTAASLAAYAAQAGIPAAVLMPEGYVAAGKLAQAMAHGARVLQIPGDFDTCLRVAEAAGTRYGIYLVNSVNPFRLEGQKTIILELLEQLAWQPPDWIVVPAGNLGNTAAFGKALEEARAWGLIDRLPRIAAVQAEGAAPFARSFARGFVDREVVQAETVATAIRIGDPASWDRAVRAIRLTDGIVTSVPDAAILAAKVAVDAAGVGCEPASAATLAGIRRLVAGGQIRADEQVVAILTGHLLKDPETIMACHLQARPQSPGANPPVTIPAEAGEVARALGL